MYGCTDVSMHACPYVCISVCVYVTVQVSKLPEMCVYIYMYTQYSHVCVCVLCCQ